MCVAFLILQNALSFIWLSKAWLWKCKLTKQNLEAIYPLVGTTSFIVARAHLAKHISGIFLLVKLCVGPTPPHYNVENTCAYLPAILGSFFSTWSLEQDLFVPKLRKNKRGALT